MNSAKEKTQLQLPRRLQGVAPTLIRQIFERALPDSINFGLGEPDLPTPQFMREAAARIALEEQNGYTNHAGLLPLREKIAEQYPHLNLQPNQICVTVGSQEAMTAAFMAIVDDGDEVLIPNPSFPAYENCVKISGGKPVFIVFRRKKISRSTSKNSNRKSRRERKPRSLFRRRIRRAKFSRPKIYKRLARFCKTREFI